MTMGDPMDQPEDEGMSLVFPFVVCQSNGGPYDDDAFTAGYQCGQIDRSLAAAAAVGATSMTCTVYTTLIKQLELVAMNRGFSNVDAQGKVYSTALLRLVLDVPDDEARAAGLPGA